MTDDNLPPTVAPVEPDPLPYTDEELSAIKVRVALPTAENGLIWDIETDVIIERLFATISQRTKSAADYRRAVPLLNSEDLPVCPSINANPTVLRDSLIHAHTALNRLPNCLQVILP